MELASNSGSDDDFSVNSDLSEDSEDDEYSSDSESEELSGVTDESDEYNEEEFDNYGYTEDELASYNTTQLQKIAKKYGLNTNNSGSNLINNILIYQNELENKKKQVLMNRMKKSLNILPSDALRVMAYNLDFFDVIDLCSTSKKFNTILCKNNIFQKEYGLRHLTSHVERLPLDEYGNYRVLNELDMLEREGRLGKYVGDGKYDVHWKGYSLGYRGYEIYLRKMYQLGNIINDNSESKFGYYKSTIYNAAVVAGYLDIVEYILYINNIKNTTTALVNAIEEGQIDVVKNLVEKGAPRRSISAALPSAAKSGYLDIVKYLVENGADIHIKNDLALCNAAGEGYIAIVTYLIEFGADIHSDNDCSIRIAAEVGNLEMLKYLHDMGGDIHAKSEDALALAARNGHLDVVKYLVENGAQVRANNNIALWLANNYDRRNIVKYLIEQGADANVLVKKSVARGRKNIKPLKKR